MPNLDCNIAKELIAHPHILFFPSWFPDQGKDLNGSFNLTWAKRMAQFCKVHVIAVHLEDLDVDFEWRENVIDNLHISRLILNRKQTKLKRWLLKSKLLAARAMELHALDSFDLVHVSVAWNMAFIGHKVSRKLGLPFYITEHSTYFLTRQKFDLKKIISYNLMRKANVVMAVSLELKAHFESKGMRKVHVIPNFTNVELDEYSSKISSLYCFAHVTNWDVERKGTKAVLDSFIKLRSQQPCKLILIANGINIETLGYSKKDLKELDIVLYEGFIDPAKYYSCLSQAHCLVNFSSKETFGISVVEAVKLGMHTIYTRSGGPETFMKEEWGSPIEVGDTPDLYKKMEMACKEKILLKAGDGHRNQLFSAKDIFEQHIKIYHG